MLKIISILIVTIGTLILYNTIDKKEEYSVPRTRKIGYLIAWLWCIPYFITSLDFYSIFGRDLQGDYTLARYKYLLKYPLTLIDAMLHPTSGTEIIPYL